MNDENNSSDKRLVSCSFCDEKFSSEEIGKHLMICGNKTDQCPNCQKYIRRAVFAYHYENNCANLEETENGIHNQTKQSYASSSSSTLQNDNDRTKDDAVLPCEICHQPIPFSSYERHTEQCQEQGEEHMETQSGPNEEQNAYTSWAHPCQYCNQACSYFGLGVHEMTCNNNPNTWPIVKNVKKVWDWYSSSSYT